jgi:chemotaxis protein methyltransferase CheR
VRLPSDVRLKAQELVEERFGLHFSKERLADFDRGFIESARASGSPSPAAYLARIDLLPSTSPEWTGLASHLTVGETCFFRDPAYFDALRREVLPALIMARRSRATLRIWSAACSTGEEPYSIAILLDELLRDRSRWDVTILGTDLNPQALGVARRGVYGQWSLREMPTAVRDGYFARSRSHRFTLNAEIRDMVRFECANLVNGLTRGVLAESVDLIVCRNALMYLTPPAATGAIARLQGALAPGGWLLVAPVEASAERFQPLTPVNFPSAIFFWKGSRPEASHVTPPSRTHDAPLGAPSPKTVDPAISREPPRRPEPAPPGAAELLAHAQALADGGRLGEALQMCSAAIAAAPLDPRARRLLSDIHRERGDMKAALSAVRRALFLDPECAEAHSTLGHLLVRQGERQRGLKHLKTAARLGRAGGP